LKGSKSMLILRSLPSLVMISPQYTTRPFGGTFEYSLRRCCVEVMAERTESRLTRDLMLEAVPCDFGQHFGWWGCWGEWYTHKFFCQHLCGTRNLILWRDDERNHACAITTAVIC
jgi:hypothetical protein